MSRLHLLVTFLFICSLNLFSQQKSGSGIRHSILISGPKTLEFNEQDQTVWQFDDGSRDIAKLPNGNYLITYSKKVVEVTPAKEVIWQYNLEDNDELMSAQRLANGKTLITELGAKPRLLEVNRKGKIKRTIPLQPETDNVHMQTRMARKLDNGRYLVPHRLMPLVKEYDKKGKIQQTFRLDIPEMGGPEAKNGGFVAVRSKDGSTAMTCTSGNRLVVLDEAGQLVWQLTTDEIDGQLQDVCGLQILKNGNFLVSCYGNQMDDGLKMMEINQAKEIVWTYQNPDVKYIHTLQVLTTNGQAE